ncbi:hypothetical protein DYD21_01820 [Rhodohalobacter sp. SW132]|uniref:hypothetical protein n=1 Tax=Rhodohalobacter sp. SW132 TaxID=2293433 RepID=UPI000E259242|nr:hypothetical protein [Rhodohalobacter sp. SW132]REL38713.1 hypothetical protein DYD21_01820 [Rhodohalobacter sp. SW132]
MKKIPSDLEILKVIYNEYLDTFRSYATEEPDRIARIRVPIDIHEVAEEVGVDEDMIFGRLYYHFNKKYSYRDENGERITFFTSLKFEGMSVNFPLVASVLADLEKEDQKYKLTLSLSVAALSISIIAIALAFFG